MASLDGKSHHILMRSSLYMIKNWIVKENGKLFKITSNNNWKNVLPGDIVSLSFDFTTGFLGYSNHTEPKMDVVVYRNKDILFKENMYFTSISAMISHFEIEKC